MTVTHVTVGDVLIGIQAGKSVKTKERPAQPGELGILKVSSVTWGEFRPYENKAVLDDYDPGDCPRPGIGDLLISLANTRDLVGAPVLVEADHPNLLLSDKILRLVPDDARVDRRYLARVLRSTASRKHFESCAGGTSGSMTNITQEDIRSAPLPLPPLTEQRRIADILDKADAIRRKRKEAIALTEELLRSAFLDMFGDPVMNPNGWPVKRLSDLLAFLTSGSRGWAEYYADFGEIFLRIQNVGGDRLDLSDVAFVHAPDSAEARRTETRPGDVLLSITADLGRTAVVPENLKRAFINQHLAILRPRGVNSEYLSSFLASEGGRRQIIRRNKGGVKAGLNFEDIRSMEVLLPPEPIQRAFALAKAQIRRLEIGHARMLEEGDTLFGSLVAPAFTGRLSTAEAAC